jgi:uncharacterized Zn-binding protein involved in type VI secretion
MRRWSTGLIVGAVVTLAVLAAADALRGDGDAKTGAANEATTTAPRPLTLRESLRKEAITGLLLYSDPNCAVHSLLLPRMIDEVVREDDGGELFRCRFEVGGGRFLDEGDAVSRDGVFGARCDGPRTVVWEIESSRPLRSYGGCPPAWRPDGRLTYPRGDRIMEENRVLFSARELRAAVRLHPVTGDLAATVPIFAHATDLAWLDENRLIVSLEVRIRGGPTIYPSVLFDGKAVIGFPSNFGSPLQNWVVSPAGSFVAAEDGTTVARDGDVTARPNNLPSGRAAAFSPDELWLAYVTGVSVYLIGTPRNGQPVRLIRLPVEAQDLTWEPVGRGTTIAPPRTG